MVINVDAGHGSNTAGKRTPPMPKAIDIEQDGTIDIKKGEQFREHYANVGVAKYLVEALERCGFKTHKTGWNDENADDDQDEALEDRQSKVVKAKCDYSISIHFNAYGDGASFNEANGVGIYIHDKYAEKSEAFAKAVLKYLVQGTKQTNRGITKKSLAMCNCKNLKVKGAIIAELAFMTNEKEAVNLMASDQFWRECAREICQGVCEYTGVKYIEEGSIKAESISTNSNKNDIKWLQEKLNKVLPKIDNITPLKVDGSYGPKTRIAVLIYWDQLGWSNLKDHGIKVGKNTIDALSKERRK